MNTSTHKDLQESRFETGAVVLTLLALFSVLWLHLLPALFGGLVVRQLVHFFAPWSFGYDEQPRRARLIAAAILAAMAVVVAALCLAGTIAFFRGDNGSLSILFERMAEIITGARNGLPYWIQNQIPTDIHEFSDGSVAWLRDNSVELRSVGGDFGRLIGYAAVGMLIGGLVSFREIKSTGKAKLLSKYLLRCAQRFTNSFECVMYAQLRIAALNSALTAIYLVIVLPLMGIQLPFTKTMIALTFIVGLIPVVGNLLSNAVIVIISLSQSATVAVASLVFLIFIHKLEYILEARIIGDKIRASTWELLLSMLVMESAFGVTGLIAAPVFYAYVKAELAERNLV